MKILKEKLDRERERIRNKRKKELELLNQRFMNIQKELDNSHRLQISKLSQDHKKKKQAQSIFTKEQKFSNFKHWWI